jgi:hypothetical protein
MWVLTREGTLVNVDRYETIRAQGREVTAFRFDGNNTALGEFDTEEHAQAAVAKIANAMKAKPMEKISQAIQADERQQ